jgi:Tfp pilus assembly protein PilX
MKTASNILLPRTRSRAARGSILITALIFSIIIAITLLSYIRLSSNSLKLAHRTFFADAVTNLAEAGTEEAVWAFNVMGNSTDATAINNAWNGWTRTQTVADIYLTSLGSGYTSPPTVTITGGGGSGATAVASLTTFYKVDGTAVTRVTGITITNPGSGYTSSPSVTLSGGGGTGATAVARRAATKTINFTGLDQGATGNVKVWVAGYDGTDVIPIAVAKATITPTQGAPITKYLKIIMNKTGMLPKGLIAKNGINWNGHPLADSYVSSATPGVPPFTPYDPATARANITVGALYGPTIDLGAGGVVNGNVMFGAGVTVTGGTVSGAKIPNLTYNFTNPTPPTNTGATGYYTLGSIPATLPAGGDVPAADGKYYYFFNNKTIGSLTITSGKNVVLVGTNTNMKDGLVIQPTPNGVPCGKVQIYIDKDVSPKNGSVNPSCWPGALEIYTTTSSTCTVQGNGVFNACLYAPFAELRGNGGGNDTMDLCGSFVVGSVTSNGHMSFHYDESLGAPASPKAWSLALWTELQSAAERAVYASKFNF